MGTEGNKIYELVDCAFLLFFGPQNELFSFPLFPPLPCFRLPSPFSLLLSSFLFLPFLPSSLSPIFSVLSPHLSFVPFSFSPLPVSLSISGSSLTLTPSPPWLCSFYCPFLSHVFSFPTLLFHPLSSLPFLSHPFSSLSSVPLSSSSLPSLRYSHQNSKFRKCGHPAGFAATRRCFGLGVLYIL